ncbi:hypothetical protein NKG94_01175 [Micromonospora sp. M12]
MTWPTRPTTRVSSPRSGVRVVASSAGAHQRLEHLRLRRPVAGRQSRQSVQLAHRPARGLASFNHPGREAGRFNNFSFNAAARNQLVGLEMFNRTDDFLFEGWSSGVTSPLVACLNAGWRPALTGVTDEHGTTWGFHEGKGRSGLWVAENTRAAVFEAMAARRSFATRVSGLRVDATANAVRMGGVLNVTSGDVRFLLDLDRGSAWDGKPCGSRFSGPAPRRRPSSTSSTSSTVRSPTSQCRSTSPTATGWSPDLRPVAAQRHPGPAGHPCNDFAVAYTSPWWLRP